MKEKKHQIETKPVLMVTNDCPLGIFRLRSYISRDREFESCTNCEFFLGENECGFRLYETRLIEHTSYCEPDDGSGALPDTDYAWDFECAGCGKVVHFTSGMSVLSPGDSAKCFDCKTKHRLIKESNGIYFFALTIDKKGVENE